MKKHTVERGAVISCPCLVSDSSSVVAEPALEKSRAAVQPLDNPEIRTADKTTQYFFYVACSYGRGLPTLRKAFRQLYQATVIKHTYFENLDSRCMTEDKISPFLPLALMM